MVQFRVGMGMRNNFKNLFYKKYFTEIDPSVRYSILNSNENQDVLSEKEYELLQRVLEIRHENTTDFSVDKFLWNCVHLRELYKLKTKPIIRYFIRSDEYEVFEELKLEELIELDEKYSDVIFYEFFNSFLRYASTIKKTEKTFWSIRIIPEKEFFKKQLEQIWQMSDGVTELIAEKRSILKIWNDAAMFYKSYFNAINYSQEV